MAGGVQLSRTVAQLLGLAGLTPQHPDSYITAWRNRCLPSLLYGGHHRVLCRQALADPALRRGNLVLEEEEEEQKRAGQ